MIPLLQPLFQGDLAPFGERLQCAAQPPDGAVPATGLCDPATLGDLLRRYATHVWKLDAAAQQDLRPLASTWTLRYLAALVPPVAAAASVLEHVFPVALEDVWIRFDAQGLVVDFHLCALGHSEPGSSTATRYAPLILGHCAPLFAAMERHARLPAKVSWSNAARHLEAVLEQTAALAPQMPGIARDAAALLQAPEWASQPPRANPMYREPRVVRIARQDGGCDDVPLHRECCLYHLLPGDGYCGRCPLDPRHRRPHPQAAPADALPASAMP
ncbi:siderophore-iron reductase FhuF [Paracidovorax anthurii]|uniref:siderophore-iron reductase FhuF n=1 Tax=Paracidovorax anthurii TaxID=78229 RepID=UPI000DCFD03B|nr:siderophore-iron reductase FhuF [Paracidovorax anthurii]